MLGKELGSTARPRTTKSTTMAGVALWRDPKPRLTVATASRCLQTRKRDSRGSKRFYRGPIGAPCIKLRDYRGWGSVAFGEESGLVTARKKVGGADLRSPPVGDRRHGIRLPAKGERGRRAGLATGLREESGPAARIARERGELCRGRERKGRGVARSWA